MSRWTKSIAAALLLLALVVGVPVMLVTIAGWPLPSSMPDIDNMITIVRQGNIGAEVVIKTIAVVVWLAWFQLMWSVLWELAVNVPKLATGRRWRPPPLVLSPIGDGVARLFSVILAVGVIASATPSESATALTAPSGLPKEAARSSLVVDDADTTRTDQTQAEAASSPEWHVSAEDDLWSISEYALGDGSKVDEILAVNPGLTPRSLRAGMVLNLPDGARTAPVAEQPADTAEVSEDPAATESSSVRRYVVQDNDGMWSVAEALLGDGSRHAELYDLLDGQEVAPGVVFTADTYMIHPGWVFELHPAAVEATGATPSAGVAASHTVVVDESLSKIARKVLGDSDRWPEIFELNSGKVMNDGRVFDDADQIMPGWVLELPVVPAAVPSDPAPPSSAPTGDQVPTVDETIEETEQPDTPGPDVDASAATPEDDVTPATTPAPSRDLPEPTIDTGAAESVPAAPLPAPAPTTPPATTDAPTVASSSASANGASIDAVELTSVRDWRTVWMVGISGATVLASGLWGLARWYRRRASARGGAQVREYNESSQLIDEALRGSADAPLLAWANVGLAELVAERGRNSAAALPVAVTLSADRGIGVHWQPPLPTASIGNWAADEGGAAWTLDAPDVMPVVVAGAAAIPGLVTVGTHDGQSVLVDLESCGSLALRGDAVAAEALIRSIVLELGAGGVLSNCQVHTVGLDGAEQLGRVRSRTESEAIEHLRTIRVQNDAVLGDAQRSSMLEVRSASSPLGREVHVVAVRASACERLHELVETATPQRGVAVVVVGEAEVRDDVDD